MKKFKEWIVENPEAIEEGWMKNLAVGAGMLGAGMGMAQNANAGDTGYTNYGPSKGGNFTRVVAPNGEVSYISKNNQTPLGKQISSQPVKSGWNKVAKQSWPLQNQEPTNAGQSWTSPNAGSFLK